MSVSPNRVQKGRRGIAGGRRLRSNGPATAGAHSAVCPDCRAVYSNKQWYSQFRAPAGISVSKLPEMLCSECKLKRQKRGDYAGEVMIEGVKDKALLAEIVQLVENVGRRAASRDPEERIVKIEKSAGKLRVLTSENQLAVSIGKQLDSARKGGRLSIIWSKGDKLVRVRWQAGI
ncbi:MAG: hypothetical protein WCT10_01040 [Patescibacteria group bacterium]|jgi:hypothetical protein